MLRTDNGVSFFKSTEVVNAMLPRKASKPQMT